MQSMNHTLLKISFKTLSMTREIFKRNKAFKAICFKELSNNTSLSRLSLTFKIKLNILIHYGGAKIIFFGLKSKKKGYGHIKKKKRAKTDAFSFINH